MVRAPRWALMALFALIISALSMGASWADPGRDGGREDPPAHGREKEDDDRHEGSEETSEEEAEGYRGAWSRPSPSPRASHSPEAAPTESADFVDVDFSASPASIAVGETSTLQVSVSNPSDIPAEEVEVLIDLPDHLELVSTQPQAQGTELLRIVLGRVDPGDSASASVVVLGVGSVRSDEPIRFAVTVAGETFHHELFVSVEDADEAGLGLSQSSPLLIQVGNVAGFSATLTNNTAEALEDVAVVTEIAPELDVVGVTPIEAADAIQLGGSPTGEDIVWIFDSLAPGEAVDLIWTARAVAPGDLQAGTVVEATLQGRPAASSSQDTYLGYVRGVRTERAAAPAPVVRERVVTKLVPVSSEVAASVGGILPVTGWSPGVMGSGGALLIALGMVLVWASRGIRSRRLALVMVGALLLTATACVSDQDSQDPDDRSQAVASPSPEETDAGDPAEEEEDQVLGVRIDRSGRGEDPDVTSETPPVAETVVPEPATEVVYQEVSEVISVVVPVAELPVDALSSGSSDNNLSFSWGPGDLQAASSRVLSRGATQEILVALTSRGDQLVATVSVTNLAEDRRLHVYGRLALDLVASDGRASSLVSDPIDVVLEPGASTAADLAFSLPSGSYSAEGIFLAD